MTMFELEKLFNDVYGEAISAGILPASMDKLTLKTDKAIKRRGCTKALDYGTHRERFIISISENTIKLGKDEIKNTMIHEILHTVKGCFNHGSLWKYNANTINLKYGYNVKRTSKMGDDVKSNCKYIVECVNCDNKIYRTRRSKVITQIEKYRCGRCNGGFRIVEQ